MPYTESQLRSVSTMFTNEMVDMAQAVSMLQRMEYENRGLCCEYSGEIIYGEPFKVTEHKFSSYRDEFNVWRTRIDREVHLYADEENARLDGCWCCDSCGAWHHGEREPEVEVDGKVFCANMCAYDAGYAYCEHCNEWHERDDMFEVEGAYYCDEYCAERDGWHQCEHCDGWHHEGNSYWVYSNYEEQRWCESCREDARYCYHCDELYNIDEMVRIDGEWVCEGCAEDHTDRDLHEYGYTPHIEFFGGNAYEKPALFMGVELETDSGRDRGLYVCDLAGAENFSQHFWMTEDSSLTNGVEITSMPMTLVYHESLKGLYEEIGNIARRHSYVSHDSGNCGLHVHVNRSFFGKSSQAQDAGGYKMMRLLQRFERAFTIFSRRRRNNWCNYKVGGDYTLKDEVKIVKQSERDQYGPLKMASEMVWSERGHSQALNFQHSNTFEFRIFRGTLKIETFFATLGLVSGLCHTAKNHGSIWVESVTWYDLMDEVLANCESDYARECLESYLTEKGLR